MTNRQGFWKAVIVLGVLLFLVHSAIFVWLGQINADEGWYLYASKLVYTGARPYEDFAFTQTPLLPYIYGIAQHLLTQSLYLGRLTSVVFSAAAFGLALIVAYRYGGLVAAGITALLWATFTYGLYFQSITKTQALVTFFFTLSLYLLTTPIKPHLKSAFLVLVVLLATLTRLSALFFALPFLLYAWFTANTKTKLVILTLGFLALGWMSTMVLPNVAAAQWGLLTHHTSQWGDLPLAEQLKQLIGIRALQFFVSFPLYSVLWLTLLITGYKQIKRHARRYFALLLTAVALLLFAIPNWISGGFYQEYFVPLVFVSLPLIGTIYPKLVSYQGQYTKAFMNLALLSTFITGIIYGGFYFIDTSGGTPPITEIRRVSAVIAENSTATDQLFVLEPLWLAVESHRLVLPGMNMAEFSFYEADMETVNQLHLVNAPIMVDYLADGLPEIVVLTHLDRLILEDTAHYEAFMAALEENYSLIYSAEQFGQFSNEVDVYSRR